MELDSTMKTEFSIILPLYKQEDHLLHLISKYCNKLNEIGFTYELILVINGKFDRSYEIALEASETNTNIKVYQLLQTGWGRAVKFGIQKAEGNLICYTNSARTNIDELISILMYAQVNTNNIIKANRIIRESFFRRLGSVLYNFENRAFFKTPVWDVNGTPKVFPASVIKNIEIISDNDLIDAELIARCFAQKISIIEIPILSTERIAGKSTTNVKSALKMYFGLIGLKRKLKL